jgi:hypothetical protein
MRTVWWTALSLIVLSVWLLPARARDGAWALGQILAEWVVFELGPRPAPAARPLVIVRAPPRAPLRPAPPTYDADGFDAAGFDREGYDRDGRDRHGRLRTPDTSPSPRMSPQTCAELEELKQLYRRAYATYIQESRRTPRDPKRWEMAFTGYQTVTRRYVSLRAATGL